MMIGFGTLKQMNDTLKQNRAMLGKRKSLRELYKEEVKNRISTHENIDLAALRLRVTERQKRNLIQEAFVKVIVVLVVAGLVVGGIWIALSIDFSVKVEHPTVRGKDLFGQTLTLLPDSIIHKIEYFNDGPKAAEGYLINGRKHQNHESYYSTGEQFRSALYYNDTIVVDYYFYKWGDTIRNFPYVSDTVIKHITLTVPEKSLVVEFDIYDGKTVIGTYKESRIRQ